MSDTDRAPPPTKPGLKLRIEERLGILDDLVLVPYRAHGTPHFLHVKGRLIEKKGLAGSPGENRAWRNILNTLRRLESDEIPGARVRVRFDEGSWDIFTDAEGFFQTSLTRERPFPPGWHDVPVELVESVKRGYRTDATAEVLVPGADAEFGVVSDLDDTVVRTGATQLLTEIKTVFPNDAATRIPFPGVVPFYRALAAGSGEAPRNPIFYVSRTGWNLYDVFVEFLDRNEVPRGPLFLQDLAVRESKSPTLGAEHHKLQQIRTLLHDYPELPFVLIGDSGQGDPETYRQIVHEHPRRIRAIYIRDVAEDARDREVEAIARDLEGRGVAVLHSQHSEAMSEHAAAHGLVT